MYFGLLSFRYCFLLWHPPSTCQHCTAAVVETDSIKKDISLSAWIEDAINNYCYHLINYGEELNMNYSILRKEYVSLIGCAAETIKKYETEILLTGKKIVWFEKNANIHFSILKNRYYDFLNEKIAEAIAQMAKEQGYTSVFEQGCMLYGKIIKNEAALLQIY